MRRKFCVGCRISSSSKMAVSVPAESQPSRISSETSCWQNPCLPPERWCMLGLTFISHTPANVPFSPPSSQQFLNVPAMSPLLLPISSCSRLGGNQASSVNPVTLMLLTYTRSLWLNGFQDSSAEPRCSRTRLYFQAVACSHLLRQLMRWPKKEFSKASESNQTCTRLPLGSAPQSLIPTS